MDVACRSRRVYERDVARTQARPPPALFDDHAAAAQHVDLVTVAARPADQGWCAYGPELRTAQTRRISAFRRLGAMKRAASALLGCVLVLGGCSSARGGESTAPATSPIGATASSPKPSRSTPRAPTPTTSRDASCPFLDTDSAASAVGVRMGRTSVLSSAGRIVGCRFYADQDPSYRASEHLPGPNQPVLQIVANRYANSTSAHNAMVRLAEAGTNAYQAALSPSVEGISFQTRFDPADGNRDWAYTFRKGTTVVVVTTVQRDTAFDARAVASAIVGRF
jgi:hypothetical protein